jgi:hypothetical protein
VLMFLAEIFLAVLTFLTEIFLAMLMFLTDISDIAMHLSC